ncbi:MAG: hypothetical protein AB7S49_05110 [Arcobacter sp.]|jgi:uncharacterized membrane protein YgaE (UPF0421/DUF939 family)|uniref:YtxH domain-containing protein n=1 Tax=Arcobacter defluvii TaxID=873191 RepID=A0AAE7BFL9_9BACT|nr:MULTISPECIES: hypothetical protein [Arcobacter]MDY3201087.1 hypothetical protein [Arcobacter sp.]QKF76904.1 hypothetical protein ADFLV_0859 [Arcobacter defluvii]RXI33760.1 hypothetical protein CP964_04920 [Arcobacter defluvii]BAK72719.1 conserved hypothetical protein [Arcobacter sp. L]
MALPFILGLAVGAGAVVAFSNKDKLKKKTSELFEKTKDGVEEIKDKLCATKECIEEKIEKKSEEKTTEKPKTRKYQRKPKVKEAE